MKKSVMKKWVAALRSGKYSQTFGNLKKDESYCCLGVLCDISKISNWRDISGTSLYEGNSVALPLTVKHWAGLRYLEGTISFKKGSVNLITLNDIRKRSFKQIAAFIERNYKKL